MNKEPKKTTVTMTVTISGAWLENGKQVTPTIIERRVRETIKDEFDWLADKVTVKRVKDVGDES